MPRQHTVNLVQIDPSIEKLVHCNIKKQACARGCKAHNQKMLGPGAPRDKRPIVNPHGCYAAEFQRGSLSPASNNVMRSSEVYHQCGLTRRKMPLASEPHGTAQTNIADNVVAELRMGPAARHFPTSEVALLARDARQVRPVELKFDGHGVVPERDRLEFSSRNLADDEYLTKRGQMRIEGLARGSRGILDSSP